MNKNEYDELMDFLDVVDLKIKLDNIIDILRKILIVDFELGDDECLYIIDKIKKMIENNEFGVCPIDNQRVIGEDCGNCLMYSIGCEFIGKGVKRC